MVDELKSRPFLLFVSAAFSVLAHAMVIAVLSNQPLEARTNSAPTAVRIQVAKPPPPKAPPPAALPPEPEKPEVKPVKPAKPTPAPEQRPLTEPGPPPEPAPAPPDLPGVRLEGGDGARFEVPAGEPRTPSVPARAGNGASAHSTRPVTPTARPAPSIKPTPLADLTRRPVPPTLDAALERNYPAEARRRGIGGRAVVRALIDAQGLVRNPRVTSETEAGFGEACRRTLAGTRWSAPIDREGRSVQTEVSYVCRFRVSH